MAASSALLQSDWWWLVKPQPAAWTARLCTTFGQLRATHQRGHALLPTNGLHESMSRHTMFEATLRRATLRADPSMHRYEYSCHKWFKGAAFARQPDCLISLVSRCSQ
jgi:hypothetical protein